MDRKKTILVAVFINAGLLAVLFVASLTTQEETLDRFEKERLSVAPATPLPQDLPQEVVWEFPKQEEPKIALPSVEEAPLAVVPSPTAPLAVAVTPPPVAAPSLPSEVARPAVVEKSPLLEVTVKKGDSLEKIARQHGTTVDAIIKHNHLPSSFLKIGQVLQIPAAKGGKKQTVAASSSPAKKNPEYYTVKVGDNPWTIAMKHHMKVEELLRLNELDEARARKLKPGDQLRIR